MSTEPESTSMRRQIVVVVGMHRSGTSLCSHVLSLLGIDMTDEIGANHGNEHGHFERLQLVEIQDEILKTFDRGYFSREHDFPFPPGWWADLRMQGTKERIKDLLRPIIARGTLVGFKDPRTARLLPMWKQIFLELDLYPRYVICLRDPAHVAASLHSRDGLDRHIGELRALDYLVDAFRYTQDRDVCFIRYADWMPDPVPNARKLVDFLGLEGRLDDIDLDLALHAVVRPALNRSGLDKRESGQSCVRAFFDLVNRYALSDGRDEALKARAMQFAQHYVSFRQLLVPFEVSRRDADTALSALSDSLASAQRQREESRERAEQAEGRLAESLARIDELTTSLEDTRARGIEAQAAAGQRLAEAMESLQAERAEMARLRGAHAEEPTQAVGDTGSPVQADAILDL